MRGFDLQGHRGARGLFPENTLAGFAATLALGVSSIELDIAVTADHVPVVVHDPALDPDMTRDADGVWLDGAGPLLRSLHWAAVRRFDVGRLRPGTALAAAFPDQRPLDGAGVPRLADVLALTVAAQVRVDAELKTDPRAPHATADPVRMAELVLAEAAAAGALPWLALRSFDWRGLAHVRAAFPAIPLAWLTDAETEADPAVWWQRPLQDSVEPSTPAAVAEAAFAAGVPGWTPVWAPDYRTLTAWAIGEAHALGLRVVPWTVNDPAAMADLIALGVDGLCTDRPDIARVVMAACGLQLPPPSAVGEPGLT